MTGVPLRARLTAIAVAVALVLGLVGTAAAPASAGPVEDEQQFISLINQYRASNGVGPLSVHGELTAGARSWAQTMADRDELAHAPDISAGVTAPWTKLGENVGVNGTNDVQQLFDAFVASAPHRANLLDPDFTHLGVGVVYDGAGKMWTTHRFMSLPAGTTTTPAPSTTAPPPSTAPSTTAAPPPTAAPTTSPPTTASAGSSAGGSATPTTAASDTTAAPTTVPTAAPPARDHLDVTLLEILLRDLLVSTDT